jgi:uncharacterized protein DUF6665
MSAGRYEGLELELQGERARALGRVAAGMEKALEDLRAYDREGSGDPAEREELAAIAAERVWFYVVQRESLGWYRHEDALRFYGVTSELILRMGPRRS